MKYLMLVVADPDLTTDEARRSRSRSGPTRPTVRAKPPTGDRLRPPADAKTFAAATARSP